MNSESETVQSSVMTKEKALEHYKKYREACQHLPVQDFMWLSSQISDVIRTYHEGML